MQSSQERRNSGKNQDSMKAIAESRWTERTPNGAFRPTVTRYLSEQTYLAWVSPLLKKERREARSPFDDVQQGTSISAFKERGYGGQEALNPDLAPPNYKLSLPRSMQIHPIFHISLLEPALPRAQLDKVTELENEEEYEVEKILGHRGEGPETEYLIKWKGCGDDENTSATRWHNTTSCKRDRQH
ncbi:Ribonuclease H-like protein [Zalerion maritima]|uniref:Ribonuclease H-like protein n=1 Tax=Zalerion maritima TaxID=339359 RepID=A0AAD5WRE8_9PEZI|nr:Ribonuclease H-like protein [Zalerion maritima]